MATARLEVGTTTIAQLENPDYADWDDEELTAGRRRNSKGGFNGRRPKVVPLQLLQELNRRVVSQGMQKMYATVLPAIDYLSDVAQGNVPPDKDRIHTCEVIINRVFGVAPQRIQVSEVSETPYEKAGIRRAIVLRNVIDVDSEEFENPFE